MGIIVHHYPLVLLFPVQVKMELKSLDPRYVYIIDVGMTIFIWHGMKCNGLTKSKAR